jgi:hypothetical protein
MGKVKGEREGSSKVKGERPEDGGRRDGWEWIEFEGFAEAY